MTLVKQRNGLRMSCDIGKATSCNVGEETEWLENELCSFSNLSVTSPTSQLILQPFRHFTFTAHSPTVPLLHQCHSSFSNPSLASPTSQALHLCHLMSRPCYEYSSILLCAHTRKVFTTLPIPAVAFKESTNSSSPHYSLQIFLWEDSLNSPNRL